MENLHDHLRIQSNKAGALGLRTYRLAYLCHLGAITASVAATILIAFDSVPRFVGSAVASLPGFFILVSTVGRLEAKGRWHFKRHFKLENLILLLKHENWSEKQVSESLRELNEKLTDEFPKFGAFHSQQSKGDNEPY